MFLNQGSGFGPLSRVRVQSKVVQGPKDWCSGSSVQASIGMYFARKLVYSIP